MIYIISFFLLFQVSLFAEKVLIITTAYNRPDFIDIQHKTFKKFLSDDYRFVVFNDASVENMQAMIENRCAQLGIECFNIPQTIHDLPYLEREPNKDYHNPSVRNCNAVQYALDTLGFRHDGIVAVVDSDLFLVKPFSFKKYLKGYQIAGLHQHGVKDGVQIPYLWIGIVFMDMASLKEKETLNFNCGKIADVPVDAGGFTHYYLKKHPDLKIKYFDQVHSSYIDSQNIPSLQQHGFDANQIAMLQAGLHDVEFFIQASWFHYRSGTNWNCQSQEYHDIKSRLMNDYIAKISQSP